MLASKLYGAGLRLTTLAEQVALESLIILVLPDAEREWEDWYGAWLATQQDETWEVGV